MANGPMPKTRICLCMRPRPKGTLLSFGLMVSIADHLLQRALTLQTCVGTGIAVMGYRNYTSGRYRVALDDEVIDMDGQSFWQQSTTLFYRTGLDPSTPHQLNITNLDSRLLAINRVTLISVSGSP